MIRQHQGFTLLEIMLVLVLIGLMLATVIPTLRPDNESAQVKTLAEQLLAGSRQQHQQAMLSGQDMGLRLLDNGYQFLRYQDNRWQPLSPEPVAVAEGIRLSLTPGESVWQEMLLLEQQSAPQLEPRAFQPPPEEVEQDEEQPDEQSGETPDEEAEEMEPDLIFRAAGDISPARITLSSRESPTQTQTLIFNENGQILMASEEDR